MYTQAKPPSQVNMFTITRHLTFLTHKYNNHIINSKHHPAKDPSKRCLAQLHLFVLTTWTVSRITVANVHLSRSKR